MKGLLLLYYLLFILISTGCLSGLIYYPDKQTRTSPDEIGIRYQSVYFETKDRAKLHAWWFSTKNSRGAVLFCHGNAGNISHRLKTIKVLLELRLNLLIFDYRGYGKSSGSPSETGTYLDAKAAWNYLIRGRKTSPDKIIVFGRSLGGSIAVWLAQNHKPGLLIVESSFTSIADLAGHYNSCIPAHTLFGDAYCSKRYITDVKCPVLIIHSMDDEMIPYSHGKKLFELANEPKEFLTISGSHNAGFMKSILKYKTGLDRFISKYIK